MEYRLLGPIEAVRDDGDVLVLGGGKMLAVLARVVLEGGRTVPVTRLIDELWPGEPPASAAHAVQVYVSDLRKAGITAVERHGAGYRLERAADQLDADRFERAVADGVALHRDSRHFEASSVLRDALALWRGEALGGVPADLLVEERRRLDELRLTALEARIAADLALGFERQVIAELETLVAREPLNERFRAQLMLALYRSGRQADALTAYAAARRALVDELGLEPSLALRELHRQILRQDLSLDVEPAHTPASQGRLPPFERELVGREHELTEVRALLERNRLVTLTGPGGCGKTTLAIEVVRQDARNVRFVELAALDDGALVPQAVAAGLGVSLSRRRDPLDEIAEYLRAWPLVILLDTCEHLLGPCSLFVSALLEAAPRTTVLATSREPLGLDAEAVWQVPPLLTPDDAGRPIEQLPQYAAVRLFLERAGDGAPLELTRENGEDVTAICRLTGGLPLAIELAAMQVPQLGVRGVSSRLGSSLDLLAATASEGRHSSMERTLEWTVRLLQPSEQQIFARLAVFAGGWDGDAAESVCADLGPARRVATTLKGLVARALVTRDARTGRYTMLDPIRQFALGLLEQTGLAHQARLRHAECFAAFAAEIGPAMPGPDLQIPVRRALTELDNLRAALSWSEHHAPDAYVRIMAALWFYFADYHDRRDARPRFERALALAGDDPRLRSYLLNGLAFAAWTGGSFDVARTAADEAAALAAECGDLLCAAYALTTLGSLERDRGDFAAARELHERASEAFAQAGEDWGVARSTYSLGLAAYYEGDVPGAGALFERARQQFDQLGDGWGVGLAALYLGRIAASAGELERAEAWLGEVLARRGAIDDLETKTMVMRELAGLRSRRGDHAGAARLILESATTYAALGLVQYLVSSLVELGAEEWALGYREPAAVVLAAASAGAARAGYVFPADILESFERSAALVRDDGRLGEAWARGGAMSLDEALAYAAEAVAAQPPP